MKLKWDGRSDHAAQIWRKTRLFRKKRIWRLFRCNLMPSTNRNAWFPPYVRTMLWANQVKWSNQELKSIILSINIIKYRGQTDWGKDRNSFVNLKIKRKEYLGRVSKIQMASFQDLWSTRGANWKGKFTKCLSLASPYVPL